MKLKKVEQKLNLGSEQKVKTGSSESETLRQTTRRAFGFAADP